MDVVINGHQAYVYCGGREIRHESKSVLFVHGAALDHTVWTLQARHFVRQGLNVLAVDLPGHGRSAGHARNRIEDYADWLIELLDALEIESCSLVGHSMGSLICLETAACHSARADALILVGTAVPMQVHDSILDLSSKNKHVAIDLLTAGGHSPSAHLGGSKNPGMWMIGGFMRLMEYAGPGVLHSDLAACANYLNGIKSASKVDCPSLLILGEKDRLTPVRATHELAKSIPDSKTAVMQKTGHAIMAEEPNRLLDLLRMMLLPTSQAA